MKPLDVIGTNGGKITLSDPPPPEPVIISLSEVDKYLRIKALVTRWQSTRHGHSRNYATLLTIIDIINS